MTKKTNLSTDCILTIVTITAINVHVVDNQTLIHSDDGLPGTKTATPSKRGMSRLCCLICVLIGIAGCGLESFFTDSSAVRQEATIEPPSPGYSSLESENDAVRTITSEIIYVETIDIDDTTLRTRADQQWIQALLAIAQSYQSIRRFQDADRILSQASLVAQRLVDSNTRIRLLLLIGERQVAIGSIAEAKKTFTTVAPALDQHQQGELARLQVLARLLDDALQTIASIESPPQRELAGSLLMREQIRINRLADAERTLALMPPGRLASEGRSRLNIATGQASREDNDNLGLVIPEGDSPDWERYCIGLVQQGLLRLAYQSAGRISDAHRRADVLARIAREHLSLYRAFNDANDPNRTIRQEIQQMIVSAASRTGQPIVQTTILTELLSHHAGQLQTETDRAEGRRIWQQAIDACRRIDDSGNKAVLFARLIIVNNLLHHPNLSNKTLPFFTQETHPLAFEESNSLINEGLAFVNTQNDGQQWQSCAYLARALVQIGRRTAAQTLIDRILEIAEDTTGHEVLTPMLLSTIPALSAMELPDTASLMYLLAINEIDFGFSGGTANIDILEWRMRDSYIEQIVRSQLESGFVDDAMESAKRINEPVLRDRLLRTAIYIYLDRGDIERAEQEARLLMVREIRDPVLHNIQIVKRRAEIGRE